MKIINITLTRVLLPLSRPMAMSTGTVTHADNLIVRIESDDGVVGWGEGASAPSMTGETGLGMLTAAHYLAPFLIGRDWSSTEALQMEMERRLPRNEGVKAAFDTAWFDAVGKVQGLSVSQLLGNPCRRRINPLSLIGTGTLQGDIALAKSLFENGYKGFKLKVGASDVRPDAERVKAIRDALGTDVLLAADANGAWNCAQTEEFLRLTALSNLDFLEQPVAPESLGTLQGLQQKFGIPFGLDESLKTFSDLENAVRLGLARGGSFKLIKAGGLYQLTSYAQAAHRAGLSVNLAGKVAESAISTAALLHVAAVVPSLDWGFSPTNGYLLNDIIESSLDTEQGWISVPNGPGLGITVREDIVQKLAQQQHIIRPV